MACYEYYVRKYSSAVLPVSRLKPISTERMSAKGIYEDGQKLNDDLGRNGFVLPMTDRDVEYEHPGGISAVEDFASL